MEVCSMSGRLPPTNPIFGRNSIYDVGRRPPTTSYFPYCRLRAGATSRQENEKSESWEPANRMFVLGMGFVGSFLAQGLKNQEWGVSGSCTSLVKKKKLEEEMGFDVYLFNANEPEPEVLSILNHHTHLIVSIPPLVGTGDPMLQHEEHLKSMLMEGNLKWLCYLSSTSVYGNCGGMWVDEDYPVCPANEKAKARLAAEEGWLKLGHDLGISTQIFRLGGIYGPGRSAVDTVIKQEPLSELQRMRASRQYTSRVHVADICQALRASICNPSSGRIYNLVDDDPAPRTEVLLYAWDLVNRKWSGHTKQSVPPCMPESFRTESISRGEKRVSNARMKKELGVKLLHPSYKSGLKSIIDHMDNPFL
ncbi:hypothetical protein RHMOL_Rhmol06G0038100 [Rhododendron molle]|uniref:Uncharacterized protein n=1 Tax=Rhododendron molle TaxID=49168 RepID=A0ACC0N9N6_RHOML|nr:hypothetical protein RHMOL_Rhmol06G0038100 [Rhododendron molle]